jgi:hypothetical protein
MMQQQHDVMQDDDDRLFVPGGDFVFPFKFPIPATSFSLLPQQLFWSASPPFISIDDCLIPNGDMLASLLLEKMVTIELPAVESASTLRMDMTGEYHVEYTINGDPGGGVDSLSC